MFTINDYKTYIIAVLMMIAGALFSFDILDGQTFIAVMAILNGGAFAALRHGVAKNEYYEN